MTNRLHFEEEKAIDPELEQTLTLLAHLKPEKKDYLFRCVKCCVLWPAGSWLVWVRCLNGQDGGWCLKCALKNFKLLKEL